MAAVDLHGGMSADEFAPPLTNPGRMHGGEAIALESPRAAVEPDAVAAAGSRRTDFAWTRACITVDALMLGGAIATAELGAARAGVPSPDPIWLLAFPLLAGALLWSRGMYAARLSLRLLEDLRRIAAATAIAAMAILSIRAVAFPDPAAAQQSVRFWAFAAVFLVGGRALLSWSEGGARRRGETLRPTLIVGAGGVGRLAAKRLLSHPELGLKPVGYLDRDPLAADDDSALPVLGASWDLERVVREHRVEQVIVTFSKAPHEVLLRLARRCEELGVRITYVPRLFDRMTERVTIEHVVGLPLLSARLANPKGWQFGVKHVIDRIVAAALILVLAPVFAAAALSVLISLGRPIFFRQARVGRDGRSFDILKFRTMRPRADESFEFELPPDTAPGGVEGDDLRTRVGDALRRTSIDELPQLFNVLFGQMSLVGPRPERPEYVSLFGGTVPRYDDRHRVKSGITGWAQVNGLRGKTSISERAELDNYYVQNWSLWLDVKILLMTLTAVVTAYRKVE